MTRTKSIYLALLAVLLSPMAANADPISYDMTYSADPDGGPDGIGSFVYDADTGFLSGLSWRFDDGLTGLLIDTNDSFLGGLVLLGGCFGCGAVKDNLVVLQVQGDFSFVFWASPTESGFSDGYIFRTLAGDLYTGDFTVTEAVPEPGTLALLGLGLVGMAARRKKFV